MSDENKSVSRREVLAGIAVASAAAVVVGSVDASASSSVTGSARQATTPSTPSTPVDHEPIDATTATVFAPIIAAGHVGAYSVVTVHGIKGGAIPVVLASASGRRFQVDVLRRDTNDGANGVRSAGRFTVTVHNTAGGRGTATSEEEGLGAMALLEALAATNADHPALLTIRERAARFPRAVLAVI